MKSFLSAGLFIISLFLSDAFAATKDSTTVVAKTCIDGEAVTGISSRGVVTCEGVLPVFNVKSYGAVGDDSADDTSAIQTAADAAALAQGTLYFPKGTYRVTAEVQLASVSISGQNHFHILGDGPVQTVISCVIPDGTTCVAVLDNKFFKMAGLTIFNDQARGTRRGLAFGGGSSGTQAGQSILELLTVSGFETCLHSTDGGSGSSDTSSEITFINLYLENCGTGFLNDSFNGLDFNFIQLLMVGNTIGVKCATAGCYIYGGSASGNGTDFYFTNGGTSTVTNFRSETIGTLFLQTGSTTVTISNVLALKTVPNTEIVLVGGSPFSVTGSIMNGFITHSSNGGYIHLYNNKFGDPTNDTIVTNTGASASNRGPGFHAVHAVHFNSWGNYRCSDANGVDTCVPYISGSGSMTLDGSLTAIYSSRKNEGDPLMVDGQYYVTCTGTTPTRQCKIRVRDGAVVYEQNIGALH